MPTERAYPSELIIPIAGKMPPRIMVPYKEIEVARKSNNMRYTPTIRNGKMVYVPVEDPPAEIPGRHFAYKATETAVVPIELGPRPVPAPAPQPVPVMVGGKYHWPAGYPAPVPVSDTSHAERSFLPAGCTIVSAPPPMTWENALGLAQARAAAAAAQAAPAIPPALAAAPPFVIAEEDYRIDRMLREGHAEEAKRYYQAQAEAAVRHYLDLH
ncbi:hypothetical protein K440DRAFT_661912 [Wilcoxina mikolae CBS 423.85]|nr:hypothetical protein K440DRAFT_661912 [Wilcoxina mikolae CBS 423.85]